MRIANTISDRLRAQGIRQWYRGMMPPGRPSPLDILMIQATPFCNLDCRYCYLPNRTDKTRIDPALFDQLFLKLGAAGLLAGDIGMVWHAGEPLVLPIAFYQDAFAQVERLVHGRAQITHHFQTNGVLLRQEHCDLVKAHNLRFSISIDGPARLHDRNRVTRAGAGSHAAALKAIRLLQENNLPFSIINVLTAEALAHPDEIYEFYHDLGIVDVCFNVEEIEGYNKTSSFSMESEDLYYKFLTRYFELSMADNSLLRMREFRGAFRPEGIFAKDAPRGSSENNPLSIIAMDVSGKVFTFSPELLDLTDPDGQDFSIGHVDTIDFTTIFDDPRFLRIANPIAQGVAACQATCSYFDKCGGGAPVNKYSETGSFTATETMFCRMTRQVLTDAVDDFVVRQITHQRQARTAARLQALGSAGHIAPHNQGQPA